MSDAQNPEEEHRLIAERRKRLTSWQQPWPNRWRREHFAADLQETHAEHNKSELETLGARVSVAGRLTRRRGAFSVIQDMTGSIQLYTNRKTLSEEQLKQTKDWQLGDIVGASGILHRSNKGDLYVDIENFAMLSIAIRPLPDKFHGLSNREARYRQRYLDLICNPETLETFKTRWQLIDDMREFFKARRFVEVETPMLHAIPGGALARPFATRHNSLNADMFLRIAPELFLKRLIIGGIERVFEINRCFRNEGLSTRHNPEFTTIEFYQAYARDKDLMNLCEELLRALARHTGKEALTYQGKRYELSLPFKRMTLREAICAYNPDIDRAALNDLKALRQIAKAKEVPISADMGIGKIETELFEKTVERQLEQPTFITAYPAETSPLARRLDEDETLTERFELFVAGREIANGFSELNDPDDQAQRFREQAAKHQGGDHEAMRYDEDYILAMEHGMPPTAGCGIGIDRLVMLFSDQASIRDVILFPQLRDKGS